MPLQSLPSSSSSSALTRNLASWLTATTSKQQRVLLTTLAATLLSAALIPSLLPARVSFFGIPPIGNVLASLSTSKEHKKKLKRKGLEKWMESEREYAWKKLLACVPSTPRTSLFKVIECYVWWDLISPETSTPQEQIQDV